MRMDVDNRLPVLVTLPESAPVQRGGAVDLEGDKLTYRWSVVGQPPSLGWKPRRIGPS
jgi:hypothetical protein